MLATQTQTPATSQDFSWLLDFEEFASVYVHIRDKQEKLQRLRLNTPQRYGRKKAGRRNIWLKARQMGISTMLQGELYHDSVTRVGARGVTISHERKATERLKAKIDLMYRYHPKPAPVSKYNSKSELTFPSLDSTLYMGTAGGRAFGRGDTVSRAHCSEYAFWPDPELLKGLSEAVPLDGRIDIESTANGFGSFFQLCQDAKKGTNGYTLIFLPWFLEPSYALQPGEVDGFDPRDAGTDTWSEDERTCMIKALAYGVNLTPAQMAFRRWKQQTLQREFAQEYPEDDMTCFLTSGTPRFNPKKLSGILARVMPPKRTELIGGTELTLLVWEEPKDGGYYVIGADAAQGLSAGDDDWADVIDWHTGKTVATLMGKAEIYDYADQLCKLGLRYHEAMLAPERKESGIAVVARCKEKAYPNLYYHQEDDGEIADQPGVDTNVKTRPVMLDEMAQWVEGQPDSFVCEAQVQQMLSFIIKNGKAQAETGAHDDAVMAGAIARYVRARVTPPSGPVKLRVREPMGKQR